MVNLYSLVIVSEYFTTALWSGFFDLGELKPWPSQEGCFYRSCTYKCLHFYQSLLYLCFDFFPLPWMVVGGTGERCWKRWRRRRVHQGGRWRHGEEAGCWGGDVLQVSLWFFSSSNCAKLSCHELEFRSVPFNNLLNLFICRRKEQEQLAALKQHHQEEIDHHKKEIERLQREIDRHKGKIRKLKHDDWGKETFPRRPWDSSVQPHGFLWFLRASCKQGWMWMCLDVFCKCLKWLKMIIKFVSMTHSNARVV